MQTAELALTRRDALPDALRILLRDYPREGWLTDPNFNGLVSFWLDRHMMFRQILAQLQRETEAFLDRDRDPQSFAQGVSRHGGMFVSQLHGHHQIEDHHYFPALRGREPRIEAGFELLDADHHALDGLLDGFVKQANAAIRGAGGADPLTSAGALRDGLVTLERLIDRHLTDEEDLIVPVILRDGPAGLG